MPSERETLAARLTPAGASALAAVGIAGPDAGPILARLFSRGEIESAATGRIHYGDFGTPIRDDVVVVRNPPLWEIHCHGGEAVVEAILGDLEAAGARRVGWRELLAALGSSPLEIECRAALAKAPTARVARILLDQFGGALARAFQEIERSRDPASIERLLAWEPLGRRLLEPWRVLIFGPANAGKSSLLNAIAGFERAIVCDRPGTTRDIVGVSLALDGWPVELLDGAGFRDPRADAAADPLEELGRDALRRLRPKVDLAVQVVDLSRPPRELDGWLRARWTPDLLIGTKSDLAQSSGLASTEALELDLCCSARTGENLQPLGSLLIGRLVPRVPRDGEAVPFLPRHFEWLRARLLEGRRPDQAASAP